MVMAQNEIHIAVPPADVFSVLSDPAAYGDWVVGSRRIRGADAGFPAVGTKTRHSRRHGEGTPVTTGADDSVADVPRTMKEHKVPRLSVSDGTS